jgi:hypothetical protein
MHRPHCVVGRCQCFFPLQPRRYGLPTVTGRLPRAGAVFAFPPRIASDPGRAGATSGRSATFSTAKGASPGLEAHADGKCACALTLVPFGPLMQLQQVAGHTAFAAALAALAAPPPPSPLSPPPPSRRRAITFAAGAATLVAAASHSRRPESRSPAAAALTTAPPSPPRSIVCAAPARAPLAPRPSPPPGGASIHRPAGAAVMSGHLHRCRARAPAPGRRRAVAARAVVTPAVTHTSAAQRQRWHSRPGEGP